MPCITRLLEEEWSKLEKEKTVIVDEREDGGYMWLTRQLCRWMWDICVASLGFIGTSVHSSNHNSFSFFLVLTQLTNNERGHSISNVSHGNGEFDDKIYEKHEAVSCESGFWTIKKKCHSLFSRSASEKKNHLRLRSRNEREIKMTGNRDREVEVKWKSFEIEIEKWNFSRILEI